MRKTQGSTVMASRLSARSAVSNSHAIRSLRETVAQPDEHERRHPPGPTRLKTTWLDVYGIERWRTTGLLARLIAFPKSSGPPTRHPFVTPRFRQFRHQANCVKTPSTDGFRTVPADGTRSILQGIVRDLSPRLGF